MGANTSIEYNQQDYENALKIANQIKLKYKMKHCKNTFNEQLINELNEYMKPGEEKKFIRYIFNNYNNPETFWKVCLQDDSYLNFGDKVFIGKYGGMYKINKFGNKVYLPK